MRIVVKKERRKDYRGLFAYLVKLRSDVTSITTQIAIERVKQFNELVNNVKRCLGTARYGFTKENLSKILKNS